MINERDLMGGLAKGLAVIETFSADRPRQSISEAATASGLDRATTRRCLLTLAHLGYADYDGKFFTLTPRVLRLGTACLAGMPLPQLVQPHLDALSDRIGESSSVAVLDGVEIVYVARAAQKKVMSIALMPGSRLPAYCTSLGRVLLAGGNDAQVRAALAESRLQPRTPYTLTDPDQLLAAVQATRQQGYALINQEVEIGLRSIAVPLRNARGQVVAALNVGLAASDGEPPQALVERYLPELGRVQAELRAVLR